MKKEKNPMDEAIRLLEYLSDTKGAEHLKLSSRHLNSFQYYSLDFVALCIFSCIVSVFFWKFVILNSRRIGPSSSMMGKNTIAKKGTINQMGKKYMGKINGIFDHKINVINTRC